MGSDPFLLTPFCFYLHIDQKNKITSIFVFYCMDISNIIELHHSFFWKIDNLLYLSTIDFMKKKSMMVFNANKLLLIYLPWRWFNQYKECFVWNVLVKDIQKYCIKGYWPLYLHSFSKKMWFIVLEYNRFHEKKEYDGF